MNDVIERKLATRSRPQQRHTHPQPSPARPEPEGAPNSQCRRFPPAPPVQSPQHSVAGIPPMTCNGGAGTVTLCHAQHGYGVRYTAEDAEARISVVVCRGFCGNACWEWGLRGEVRIVGVWFMGLGSRESAVLRTGGRVYVHDGLIRSTYLESQKVLTRQAER